MMEIEVTLSGDGIQPGEVRSRHIAQLIENVESVLEAIMIKQFPALNLNAGDVRVGLSRIENGSLRTLYHVNYPDYALSALQTLGQALQTRQFDTLPSKAVEGILEIQKVTRQLDCHADFASHNGEYRHYGQLRHDTEIRVLPRLKLTETVYGSVVRVGGENPPRVKFRLLDGTSLSARITASNKLSVARILGQNLYNVVGVEGEASRNPVTLEIDDFVIARVLPYRETDPVEAFTRLGETLAPWIESIGGLKAYEARVAALQEDDD